MASPFSLSGKKKDKAGSADYSATLKKNMARYKDRDEAVRKTNIATGHGNSTAQRFMHEGGGAKAAPAGGKAKSGGGGGTTGRRKTTSTKKRGNFSLPKSAPIPTPRSMGSPDLAVSPPHPADPMAAGAPTNAPMIARDLAVSPQHPADPMAAGAPTSGLPPPMMPLPGGVPPGLMPPTMSPTSVPGEFPPMPPPLPGVPPGLRQQPKPPIFNDYGFKSEPQDPNEPWWKALLRG